VLAQQAQLQRARQRQRDASRAGLQHLSFLSGVHPQRHPLDRRDRLASRRGEPRSVRLNTALETRAEQTAASPE
jgi:hypothetical protein